jgi:hypothetical protein
MSELRTELVRRLRVMGVEERTDSDSGLSVLFYRNRPFAHFHDDNELDLRLTRALIRREGLVHPENSRIHPQRSKNSQWIEVRFTRAADLTKLVHLVALAIERLQDGAMPR